MIIELLVQEVMDVQENLNNMKNCKNCNVEFTPIHESRGHEQVYCSIKCRSQAYKNRKELNSKMFTEENVKQVENEILRQAEAIKNKSGVNMERQDYRINPERNVYNDVNLEMLEGKYQAKTEALEYKLRYENITKELEEAKKTIINLELEIEELESENNSEDENPFNMKNIMGMVQNNQELGNAVGKLLQNEKLQNFIISIVPDTNNN